MIVRMSSEGPKDKPKPMDDVTQGLNLLFRAAKTAVASIPTDNIENFVVGTAQGVGKALESVAETIDKELFHPGSPRNAGASPPPATPPAAAEPPTAPATPPATATEPSAPTAQAAAGQPAAPSASHDDAYAPEPRKDS
jgi:hypothetical protein